MKLSFEFFPSKTDIGLEHLHVTLQSLLVYKPEYCSVTFGAGGSTQDATMNTVTALMQQFAHIAPHISCVGMCKQRIDDLLQQYQAMGVKRLVVLRGDQPSGSGSAFGDFHYAADLVAYIRELTGEYFHISVGVYPEKHPQAQTMQDDLAHFKSKVQAGADAAITQYFYNAEAYYDLRNDCERLGIDIPLIPGIMPVIQFSQLARFSDMCGAQIPRYMRQRLTGLGDDTDAVQAYGLEIVTRLCQRLIEFGAPGLHFYTLNKPTITSKVIEALIS
jgi:methylenetetrahydrofolate reductase (NADPH)